MRACASEAGKLKSTTTWADFVPSVKSEDAYLSMLGQPGSTPHDIFDDFLEELAEKYKEDRAKIKKWAKAQGMTINSASTFSWFEDQLKKEEGYGQIPEETRRGRAQSGVWARDQNAQAWYMPRGSDMEAMAPTRGRHSGHTLRACARATLCE